MATNGNSTFRLLIAGCATLLLLFWISFIPDALPGVIVSPRHPPNVTRILVSAFLCLLAMVPLAVVLFRGSTIERLVSGLVLVFPALVLLWIVMGSLAR